MTKVREAKLREHEALAETMGLDLKDPHVKRELARLEQEAFSGAGANGDQKAARRAKQPLWRRLVGFLQRNVFVFLYLAYVAIGLHLMAAVYHTLYAAHDEGGEL